MEEGITLFTAVSTLGSTVIRGYLKDTWGNMKLQNIPECCHFAEPLDSPGNSRRHMANAEAKADAKWTILTCVGKKLAKNADAKKVELPGLHPNFLFNISLLKKNQ